MEALGGVINDQPSRRHPPAAHYSHIYPINEKKKNRHNSDRKKTRSHAEYSCWLVTTTKMPTLVSNVKKALFYSKALFIDSFESFKILLRWKFDLMLSCTITKNRFSTFQGSVYRMLQFWKVHSATRFTCTQINQTVCSRIDFDRIGRAGLFLF